MHDSTIPFGPMHPALKEPACIKVSLDGNIIREAKIRLGYAHKGIEQFLEGKKVEQALHIVQRICGICSFCHSNCFIQAIEKILDYDSPRRVKYIRALISEIERIQSHTLWAGFMMHEIGFETMFQYFMRDREHVLEIFERITGGRVHHGINKPKTVKYDITDSDIRFILDKMKILEKQFAEYLEVIQKNKIIKKRLENVGVISKETAKRFCLVGPIARASGVINDIRKKDPYCAYSELDFDVIAGKKGDAQTRSIVRIREAIESIKIIKQLLKNIPDQEIPKSSLVFIKEGMSVGRVEAPRGENFHMIKIENNAIERAKIRPPTFAIIEILPMLLENRLVGDIPVIVASLDPCFSCLERIIVAKDKKIEVLNENEFRHKYV